MFSKACEYAIRATIYVAQRSSAGERSGIRDIAREIDSPEAFTAKIMQSLSRYGIVQSLKGPTGGFEIGRQGMREVRLGDIVKAIDGPEVYKRCAIGLKECSEKTPCPLHEQFSKVREELRQILEQTLIADLSEKVNIGAAQLKV